MKAETIAVATATLFFGFVVGWLIGGQQGRMAPVGVAQAPAAPQAAAPASAAQPTAVINDAEVQALKSAASQDPKNATVRTQLGNLYYDAGQYNDAITWYQESLKVDPKDPDVSTDLAICYYNLNQPDRALKQFEYSLSVDPKHTKSMLNMGIVRAFGKQDLKGAVAIWNQLIAMAPGSADAQAAKKVLDNLKAAHPELGDTAAPAPKTGKDG
jgi:tetratricopeptide (TPR) repeat protein